MVLPFFLLQYNPVRKPHNIAPCNESTHIHIYCIGERGRGRVREREREGERDSEREKRETVKLRDRERETEMINFLNFDLLFPNLKEN